MRFETINTISIYNPSTWKNKLFLTFDVDWASDKVLSFTLDILEKYSIKATFFITHETTLIKRMADNPNIEVGIHPNFNHLLDGDARYGKNMAEVLKNFKKLSLNSCSVRSHSMVQGTQLLELFEKHKLVFDCNHFIPYDAGIELKPWFFWNNTIIKVPYFWEDDVHCRHGWEWNPQIYAKAKGIKVFDFHPIHIYLNTEHLDRYHQAKEFHAKPYKLSSLINKKHYGTRNFLLDLIKEQV